MDNLYFNAKKLKKIKNKRSCRTMKIWGWILAAIGGINFLDGVVSLFQHGSLSAVADSMLFLIPGILLIYMANKQVNKWTRYEALIDKQGNTSISMIAEKMKLPINTVYADLKKMIDNDFFIGPNYNIQAYLDGQRDMLVMTVAGKPIKPLQETAASPDPAAQTGQAQAGNGGEQAAQSRPSEAGWQDDENAPEAEWKQEPTIKVKMTDLEMIQKAIAETPDEGVRNSLYGIEGSLRRIDGRVQTDPDLKKTGSIRNLYRYYLPQIMELIREYQDRDTPGETRNKIADALHTSAEALGNIEADILEREQMDIEVDIEVLKNMFAQDGLLGNGFDSLGKTGARNAAPGSGAAVAQSGPENKEQPQVQTHAS